MLTAWAAVVEAGGVYTGQRVLIHAGAGGVGHFAVQLASYYGAHVITTASERNHEWLRELGADQVIDYRNERFEDVITEPVDVVIDLIGNVKDTTGTRSLRVLRDGGTLINVPTGSYPELFEEAAAENRDIVASTLKLSPRGASCRPSRSSSSRARCRRTSTASSHSPKLERRRSSSPKGTCAARSSSTSTRRPLAPPRGGAESAGHGYATLASRSNR